MSNAINRRKKRDARIKKKIVSNDNDETMLQNGVVNARSDDKIAKLLSQNEDDLLNFVVKVNKVYQEKLKRPAPFMTFVICGMQSTGKSTIMERFMSAVLNIVQEGTGTRCPLDTTCIHEDGLINPKCELSGEDLDQKLAGEDLSVDKVFEAIIKHNQRLADDDKFSSKPLTLVYRARNVQNMRFVDTPGIISNKGQGKDNREDIQDILRNTMKGPNTKLCVLLEPKEFSTNSIIDFCDETFGGKRNWSENAIFLMTKFDKQLEDSRTGRKANNFFKEFHENNIFPHLVITSTLPKEDLPHEELFKQRQDLLAIASEQEDQRFSRWLHGHEKFLQSSPDDELLHDKTKSRIGFESAKKVMREIMLEDTALRLPEVLTSLRRELGSCQNQLKTLKEKERFNDPNEVKLVVQQVLERVQKRMNAYLDGDLETAVKFPDLLQTLDEELQEEEDSEWCSRELNHFTEEEDRWRDRVSDLDYKDSPHIQTEMRFLGGKQVQRAINMFGLVMIDSLPDPYELKNFAATGAGYLQGGLQRENWERVITAITKMSVKKISHPGINFLIKHVGQIFRRLFKIALNDIKQGDEISTVLKLLPPSIESHLIRRFDEELWDLMVNAADKSHVALEPMYSTLDPTLPTFHPDHIDNSDDQGETFTMQNGTYVKTPNKKESQQSQILDTITKKFQSLWTLDGSKAKEMLKHDSLKKASQKNHFLPDERTSMMTSDETDVVIRRAFQYIVALMEFNLVLLRFQMNHYLYEGFKVRLNSFTREILLEDFSSLVEADEDVKAQIQEIEGKIQGLADSLQEVQRIQSKF